jgi:hypothetical protein
MLTLGELEERFVCLSAGASRGEDTVQSHPRNRNLRGCLKSIIPQRASQKSKLKIILKDHACVQAKVLGLFRRSVDIKHLPSLMPPRKSSKVMAILPDEAFAGRLAFAGGQNEEVQRAFQENTSQRRNR